MLPAEAKRFKEARAVSEPEIFQVSFGRFPDSGVRQTAGGDGGPPNLNEARAGWHRLGFFAGGGLNGRGPFSVKRHLALNRK